MSQSRNIRACLALWLVSHAAFGAEVVMRGISVPFFDPSGKLTHKLLAKHGTKAGELQQLHRVEIHYFSPTEPNVVVKKLEAAEATWNDRAEILAGNGSVNLMAEENRMSGVGFDFSLATSLLRIHRDFKMENRDVVLTSRRATIQLVIDKAGEDLKLRDVKRCEAMDDVHIVVLPSAQARYRVKEAFSSLAVYEGATKIVSLPKPTRMLKTDGGTAHTEHFEFLLEDQGKK